MAQFRKTYLAQNPVCQMCRRALASDIHHRKKLRGFPHLKYDPANLQGLCGDCHKSLPMDQR